MHSRAVLIYHAPGNQEMPGPVAEFARERGLRILPVGTVDEVLTLVNRSFPACIVTGVAGAESETLCRKLKSDAFSAIVPVIYLALDGADDAVLRGLRAGADEVLTARMDEHEQLLRIQMALNRADRDVSVNPTTRLPGTAQIERDIAERLRSGELFAVCYADLDHFKEYNDRYGYNEGDRVILLVSRILRDLVRAHAPTGFVGHIGGDDFIFNVPLDKMRVCCEEIIEVFDELIPYQYDEQDRRLGYFLGKDRRGNILKIPLMTISIGVVTNEYRRYTHTARVSEIATEMKAYAKSLPGSVYAVDRRRDIPASAVAVAGAAQTEATESR